MTAENRIKVLDKERAHNSWMSDYVKPYPDRLFFAAPVSINDVATAITEARRAVNELGSVAIMIKLIRQKAALWTGQSMTRFIPRCRSWEYRSFSMNQRAAVKQWAAIDTGA